MKKIVVIGSGLAGSYLSSRLCSKYHVSVIELPKERKISVRDIGTTNNVSGSFRCGLGGTSELWHAGLTMIDGAVDPIVLKAYGSKYISRAFLKLSGFNFSKFKDHNICAKNEFKRVGIPSDVLNGNIVLYPKKRWTGTTALLNSSVDLYNREVIDIDTNRKFVTLKGDPDTLKVKYDILIISAGTFGTPFILKDTLNIKPDMSLYHDHHSAFVFEFRCPRSLKLTDWWNDDYFFRQPIVVHENGIRFSFQIRDGRYSFLNGRSRAKSVISELRNYPFRLRNYAHLAYSSGDLIDVIRFKTGVKLNSRWKSVYMMAENSQQIPLKIVDRYLLERNLSLGNSDWMRAAQSAVYRFKDIVHQLGGTAINDFDWQNSILYSAHHCGSTSPNLIDTDTLALKGHRDVYVCDASILFKTGYSNTGLTLAAVCEYLYDNI